jgi:hypothetical protein
MPVNFQEIQPQVRDFGRNAAIRQKRLGDLYQEMLALLTDYANQADLLTQKISQAAGFFPGLRCAVPTQEPLNAHFSAPEGSTQVTLLAADGSQIFPSRHDPVEFCVINIGILRMQMGSENPPTPLTRSKLLKLEELYSSDGVITEDRVSMIRDLSERKILAELAILEDGPVIALTDGPLEIHYGRKETNQESQLIQEYLETLTQLFHSKASTAGYIDKPASDLVGRLLEIAKLPWDELLQAGKARPFQGVPDRVLFSDLLENPGDRSAVFSIQSLSKQKFNGDLGLYFFYLNVGRKGHPHLARVEIPAWVARNVEMLNLLHSTLVAQCAILGNRYYPYLLHRAHEVAVVTVEEKEQVENMIVHEFYHNGIQPGEISGKQGIKNQARRKEA